MRSAASGSGPGCFFATLTGGAGTLLSTFWIMSANSWMQTPADTSCATGLHAADWWAIVFNPSFPYRLVHMALARISRPASRCGGRGLGICGTAAPWRMRG